MIRFTTGQNLLQLTIVLAISALVCLPLLEAPFLSFDDYRYLQDLNEIESGVPGALKQGMIVENRWDQHWWIPEGTYVRFFRPFVILSYAIDKAFWGSDLKGFVVSNILFHLLATVFLFGCLKIIIRSDLGAFIGALSFGLQPVHFENVFYIAGRTDTIAGLCFLLFLYLYLRLRSSKSKWSLWLLGLICFFAFLSKEYNILLLPLIVLLDYLIPAKGGPLTSLKALLKQNSKFYLGFVFVFIFYYVLRLLMLGADGSGAMPYPYFYLPGKEGFLTRTIAVMQQYSAGLAVGTSIQPFLVNAEDLYNRVTIDELWIGVVWISFLCVYGLFSRKGLWFAFFFLLTLTPMLLLYSSARYLYLPSIGYCGLLGLLAAGLANSKVLGKYLLLPIISIFFVAVPAFRLFQIYEHFPREINQQEAPAKYYARLFKESELSLNPKRPVFLIDFPGNWLAMQFYPEALGILYREELPHFSVLSQVFDEENNSPTEIKFVDSKTLILSRKEGLFNMCEYEGIGAFHPRELTVGSIVDKEGYRVKVLEKSGKKIKKIRVSFSVSIQELEFGQFFHGPAEDLRLRRIPAVKGDGH